ncbi:enoyl-CoA hydratase/isomerase family protein [Sedimentitalea sp.]|uniref:enoyl-CoA hydratase/isomerase family protein n=1 Tax=Sedimentitalea sp. TaxID=2048915 RepID=UPI003298B276
MPEVRLEREGHIAWLILDNPDKRNAVNGKMSQQIKDAYKKIESNPDIRVVIITGVGDKAFCSGGDMSTYLERGVLGKDGTGKPYGILKPTEITKPIIAAMKGYCLAGGFGLALACDLRIADTNLRMGPSALKRGLVPAAQQAERLVKLVPFGKALEILLLSKYVDAQEALDLGLVQHVVETDEVLNVAKEWAEIIASYPPEAVRETKKMAYETLVMDWEKSFKYGAEVMEKSYKTDQGRDGFVAYFDKRAKAKS